MYTRGGGLATTDPRTMHIQQITGFFSRVGFFLFFSFFFKNATRTAENEEEEKIERIRAEL